MDLEKLIKLPREEILRELKKLPPEERIEKINEIEKARKKEEEETKKLIEETINEINLEDRIPEEHLLEEASSRREEIESTLEEGVRRSDVNEEKDIPPSYKDSLEQVSGLYTELREIVQERSNDYANVYRAEEIYNEIINKETYLPNEEIKDIAFSTRKLMKDLRGSYLSRFYND